MTFDHIPTAAQYVCQHTGARRARITRTEREQVRLHAAAFDVFDNKGREFGHMFTIDREFWVIDADSRALCPVEALDSHLEETFLVEPHGMRDGKVFGPMPTASYKRFRTLAEAEAYAADVITRAEKRAIKKASA